MQKEESGRPTTNEQNESPQQRLSRALQFKTVSAADPDATPWPDDFPGFESFLASAFPLINKNLKREAIGKPGLLYTWSGTDKTLAPLILTAHYDVVPAGGAASAGAARSAGGASAPDTAGTTDTAGAQPARQAQSAPASWVHPPFSGAIADGCIWGRGALDDKSSLMGIMEAVESLLREGFSPQRSIMLAFGGDEEVTGTRGAARIAAHLQSQGVRAACLIDEGTAVVSDAVSFVKQPIALIGTAEKGYVDFELSCSGQAGHAAMPARPSLVGRMARALRRLERRPFKARLLPDTAQFLRALAPGAPSLMRPVLAHPMLFWPLLKMILSGNPKTDALIRTTIAPTMLEGSQAPNVLPDKVRAVLNLRLLPGDTIESARQAIIKKIADPQINVKILLPEGAGDPVPQSGDNAFLHGLHKIICEHFPDALAAPYLVTATTDSKHYRQVADCILRFLPLPMNKHDLAMIHGVNERIKIDDYLKMINVYMAIIRNLQ